VNINELLLFLEERLMIEENIDSSASESEMLCSSVSSLNESSQNLSATHKRLRESARLKLLSEDFLQKLVFDLKFTDVQTSQR
jgi:hypothetical protein